MRIHIRSDDEIGFRSLCTQIYYILDKIFDVTYFICDTIHDLIEEFCSLAVFLAYVSDVNYRRKHLVSSGKCNIKRNK